LIAKGGYGRRPRRPHAPRRRVTGQELPDLVTIEVDKIGRVRREMTAQLGRRLQLT